MGASAGRLRVVVAVATAIAALVAVVVWAVATWEHGGPPAVREVRSPEAVAPVGLAADPLRVHLSVPRHLVAGHPTRVGVSVTGPNGTPLDPETPLVVVATLAPVGPDEDAPVVLEGPGTRAVTAGELHRSPLELLPVGEPACDEPAAELTVRVTAVDGDDPQAHATRELLGPPCDGPTVVPAPDSVHFDRPVRMWGSGWRDRVDRLMRSPQAAPWVPARTDSSSSSSSSSSGATGAAAATPRPDPAPGPADSPEPAPSTGPLAADPASPGEGEDRAEAASDDDAGEEAARRRGTAADAGVEDAPAEGRPSGDAPANDREAGGEASDERSSAGGRDREVAEREPTAGEPAEDARLDPAGDTTAEVPVERADRERSRSRSAGDDGGARSVPGAGRDAAAGRAEAVAGDDAHDGEVG